VLIWQYDICKYVAWPHNPSGRYYWTSTYYLDRDEFSSDGAARSRVINTDQLTALQDVHYTVIITKSEPGRGNIISVGDIHLLTGTIDPDPDGYNLLNIARCLTFHSDGRHSYRMVRSPMPMRWIEGGLLASAGQAVYGGYLNNMIGSDPGESFRNKHGSPMVGGRVPTTLSMWQLRHGTKRRERVY